LHRQNFAHKGLLEVPLRRRFRGLRITLWWKFCQTLQRVLFQSRSLNAAQQNQRHCTIMFHRGVR